MMERRHAGLRPHENELRVAQFGPSCIGDVPSGSESAAMTAAQTTRMIRRCERSLRAEDLTITDRCMLQRS